MARGRSTLNACGRCTNCAAIERSPLWSNTCLLMWSGRTLLGGFFIWLSLPRDIFANQVRRLALQEGVALAAGAGFFVNPVDGDHHMRLAYSCARPEEIDSGIRVLGQVIHRARLGKQ